MSLGIAGTGWVTPLGSDLCGVWQRLLNGETGRPDSVSSPLGRTYPVIQANVENVPLHPRLRRSSSISRFAVVAGLAALNDAKLQLDADTAARTGMIFAVSNGGVIYTKRFYDQIVESGANAASPLLFPETVFNAAASHVASVLGITGATYTLVGDGAVGILAMKMAEDLMATHSIDHCLVIGAEETDWLLCDAYRKWRLLRSSPPIEPFNRPTRGTILSEGAGAVVLNREGSLRIEAISAGTNFHKRAEAKECIDKIFVELCEGGIDLVIASANGTFIDTAEYAAIGRYCPTARVYAVKGAVGESIGASGLWQTICGVLSLRTQMMPSNFTCGPQNEGRLPRTTKSPKHLQRVLVSVCGMNQQTGGLRLVYKTP